MKLKQLQRLFEIDRRIRAGEHPTADSLSIDLEVSKRQIYADRIRLIHELGAPLVRDPKTNGWKYTDKTWVLPTARLSEGEIVALFLTIEIARSALNAGFEIPLESAIEKIARSLGNFVSVNLNTLKRATSHGLTPSAQANIATLVALYEAIGLRQKVHIHYFSANRGEFGERIIHPYHILETRGEKILFAWDENRDALRNFNVARISKLTPLNAHFQMDENFDPAQTIANMLFAESGHQTYNVAIGFDEYQTRFIRERHWHPHEELTIQPDGSSTLTFPASGLNEVARWVLGFGRHAEALEPPELRTIMSEHIGKMSEMYEVEK